MIDLDRTNEMIEKKNTILLIDWPGRDVPLKLLQSGFTVFSYSPEGYSLALLETNPSAFSPDIKTLATAKSEKDGLVFRPLNGPPESVDLVVIYRPAEEHSDILRTHVIRLGAKMLWLQPPVESVETKKMALELGIRFVQGRDIREISLSDLF
jgi:predicted CoA-binding protein